MERRVQQLGLEDFTDYTDYLEVHPEEFTLLFNTILISVTSFFRDPASWDALAGKPLAGILERRAPRDAIRVWSAGCASGQEPYTLAMILAEALGPDAFRD